MKRKNIKLLALALSVIVLVSAISVAADSSLKGSLYKSQTQVNYKNLYEKVIAADGFLYGIDYDWFMRYDSIGHNLGANHVIASKSTCSFNADLVYNDLFTIKALGFNAVNFWLFTWLDGIKFDGNGNIQGLDEYFLTNLKTTLDMCRQLGLNLVLSVQPHLDDINNGTSKALWDKYTQFLYNPTVREQYVTLCVQPVCELVKDYQDTVMIMCLTVEGGESDVNDPGLGQYSSRLDFGTTWGNYAAFLTAVNKKIKEIMPTMPTSVESIDRETGTYKYNSIGLDLIGVNRYNRNGSVPDIENRISTLPMYIGEFNLGVGFNSVSTDYWTMTNAKFYPNARKAGYIGAFYYSYCTGGNSFSLYDNSSSAPNNLRNIALTFHYMILDDLYKRKGLEDVLDVPAMLANRGGKNVYWIGSRTAVSYKLEKSEDGGKTWKVLEDNLDADLIKLDNGVCAYEDNTLVSGINTCYRVAAYDDEGHCAVSKASNVKEAFIPVELVKDGGFESGKISDTSDGNGWYKVIGEAGAISTADFHSGSHSYCVSYKGGKYKKVGQVIEVKPNTAYELNFWVNEKGTTIEIMVLDEAMTQRITEYWPNNTGGWKQCSRTFNSGNNTKVVLCLQFGTVETDIAYFDDISMKEIR